MGLLNDKRNVFTTIGAYNSLKENLDLPDPTNLYPSINNKQEVVPFLLDVLKVITGTDGLKQLTGEMVTNMTIEIEPKLKSSLRKQLTDFNSGDGLPSSFSSGIEVPVKNIDTYGKFKIKPTSDAGSLLYDENIQTFDKLAYQAIQNEGTDTNFGNLTMNYNSTSDAFTFKPTPDSANGTIGNWFNEFLGGIIILNKKDFITNVLNGFYGSMSNELGKTQEQLVTELTINKSVEDVTETDTFEISQNDLADINERARQIADGIMLYDLGCGLMEVSLPFSGLTEVVKNIVNSSSPHYISNQLEGTINTSAGDNEATQIKINNNKETIRDNFFQRLIRLIINTIIQALVLVPQVRTLFALRSAFINNGIPQIGNPKDDLENFETMIKCLNEDIKKMINEFIFSLILTFLIALLQPIIIKIIKEKINQYIGVLKSLISSKL